MRRQDVLDILAAHHEELKALAVKSLALFGSVARDEATETSDVDVLVEFDRPVGLFHVAHVRRRLSEMIGRPVDLVTAGALREEIRESVLRDAIYAA